MAFRRPEENRRSSNRQPGVEIANNRMPSRPRFNPGDMPTPMPTPGMGPVPMPSPMPFPFPRKPVPGIDLLGNLPGAKPPPHMIDQLGDMFGFGDRRKERYIANTRGGYEGIGSLMQMAGYVPGDYGDDDYGPFIPPSVIEGDMDFQYGPSDEYEFDYLQGLDVLPDFKPEYIARGGIVSLRR